MSASSPVTITELIDRYPLGPSQIKIIVLCGLVALFDGFDLLAIGVAGPAIAGPLHVASRRFGFTLSATLFGLISTISTRITAIQTKTGRIAIVRGLFGSTTQAK